MAEIVQPGRRDAWWKVKLQLRDKPVEYSTDCCWMDRTTCRQAEYWYVGLLHPSIDLFQVGSETCGELGAHRNDSVRVELSVPNEQDVTGQIGIPDREPDSLPDAQSQPIEQCEYRLTNETSSDCATVIAQRVREREQTPYVGESQNVWNSLGPGSPRDPGFRIDLG